RVSPKQLIFRLIKIIKNKFIHNNDFLIDLLYSKKENIRSNTSFKPLFINYVETDQDAADKILENEFQFLNKEFKFNKINWNKIDDNYSILWLYEFNYFNYLSLVIGEYNRNKDYKYIDKAVSLTENWIEETEVAQEISWDPYPTSRRIVNWINAVNYLERKGLTSKDNLNKIKKSIFLQTSFLNSNLEYDLNNNHLTSDLKALIFSGIFFEGKEADKWLNKGISQLKKRRQIEVLKDGFHDERSSSYHMVTLKDYLEIYLLLKRNKIEHGLDLDSTIEKMFETLLVLIRPNLKLPLLNDSVEDYPINVQELMAVGAYLFKRKDFKWCAQGASLDYFKNIYSEKDYQEYKKIGIEKPAVKTNLFKDAGYFIYRDGWEKEDRYLIFDFDSINPKYCPGHSHSDDLSFELYAGGEVLLLDPGVYSYHDENLREYFKSTKNHNTISINDNNKSKLIDKFRVSKTGKTKLLNYSNDDQQTRIKAVNIDYKGNKHKREINIEQDDIFLVDEIEFKKNKVNKVEAFFNLAPYFSRLELLSNNQVKCLFDNVVLTIQIEDNLNLGKIKIEESLVSYKWNELFKSKKLVYCLKAEKNVKLKTKISISNR
ncbi:MAG: heparinase II/III domain-containing protein, partial [Bacillota bacterium]